MSKIVKFKQREVAICPIIVYFRTKRVFDT